MILVAIFIRAVTLEGAFTGIIYFFNPEWEKLTDAKVIMVNSLIGVFYCFK